MGKCGERRGDVKLPFIAHYSCWKGDLWEHQASCCKHSCRLLWLLWVCLMLLVGVISTWSVSMAKMFKYQRHGSWGIPLLQNNAPANTTVTRCMQLQCYVTANRNQTLEPNLHKTDTNIVWAKNEIFQYFRCFFSSADFYVLSYDWLVISFLIVYIFSIVLFLSIFILQCLVAVIVYVSWFTSFALFLILSSCDN